MVKGAWALYDRMIEGIPEDLKVIDYCLGVHWSCVVADCGGGVSYTCQGGAKYRPYDMREASLREAADCGLDNISGRVVVDTQEALFSCRTGNRFGSSLRVFTLDAPAQR